MAIKKQERLKRGAGILLPVFSLPSEYGIGTLGYEAYEFVDFLCKCSQSYWQVLPLGPTSYGDSPYQSFSAFAGNPYFIDLDKLCKDGMLTKKELESCNFGNNPEKIDYEKLYKVRFDILHIAFSRSNIETFSPYVEFCKKNSFWLDDYALFMSLKSHFEDKQWLLWDEDIRLYEKSAVEKYKEILKDKISFWKFCQFEFYSQWYKLKDYANKKGISIIGDIPIYVSLDSSDVWVNSTQFQLDDKHIPTAVAGVPPDMFSATGQLWGNPLYNWDKMEKDGFSWWKKRMQFTAEMYDLIRIDHFIGIVNYFSIPYGSQTAVDGKWVEGPSEKLVSAINEVIGEKKIIAEDLGAVTQKVVDLLEKSGYPGMKLMQFGFESDGTNTNLPAYFTNNSIVYGGTHDNETMKGFFDFQSESVIDFAMEYLCVNDKKELTYAVIRSAYASVADTAIFQLQDFLLLDNTARINTPSTLGGNWQWRVKKSQLSSDLSEKICKITSLYGRKG